MKRLFLALQVPSLWQPVLDRAANGLANTRWLSAQNRHITLHFLGDTGQEDESRLIQALAHFEHIAVRLELTGVMPFPYTGCPRVVVAELADHSGLLSLQHELADLLRQADLPAEKKKFRPHITLGRCKKVDQSKLREYLSIWPELQAPQVTADRLRLYQSHLDPKGASYEIVGEWVLA